MKARRNYAQSPARAHATLQAVADTINGVPGALAAIGEFADGLKLGHERYKATHWNRAGVSPAMLSSVASPFDGVVELGQLAEIGYLTQKGRDHELVLYQHKFSKPFPILGEAVDGSGLVIVRGHSAYSITSRGIEG